LTSSLSAAEPRNRAKGLFEFRDGDRVVFLGSAFIERLQNTGYLETMLTAAMPGKNITFRNLGWSGDTVWGDARAVFGSRADGFKRLLSDVALCKPTVLIVCYGENEAYAGEAGLEEFRGGLNTLLDSLEASGARIVLLGPRQHEKMPLLLPDPAKYNADLRKYNDLIAEAAAQREHTWVDLYDGKDFLREHDFLDNVHLTENGVHLSTFGDWLLSINITSSLNGDAKRLILDVDASTGAYDATDGFVSEFAADTQGVSVTLLPRQLPDPQSPLFHYLDGLQAQRSSSHFCRMKRLAMGEYKLLVNGKTAETGDADSWAEGNGFLPPEEESRITKLRQAINEKNTLFFHRYRPQNETYLFLFRKHEQGNNAVEIPRFDPLIADLEKKIAELKKPVKQKYELIKVK
jgi:lysophospholipase L1-like esterase